LGRLAFPRLSAIFLRTRRVSAVESPLPLHAARNLT
jgi:hypothetical protein